MAWRTHTDGQSPMHVWPERDLIEHDLDGDDCVCGPRVELIRDDGGDVWQIIHASLDGRELDE